MTVFNSPAFAAKAPAQAHGAAKSTNRIHQVISLPATLSTGDVINVAYLPPGAVVAGVTLKAQGQLDGGAAPTLTFDFGTASSPQLFNAATQLVGRVVGPSYDGSISAAGRLYKNTTGAKQCVTITVHTGAATPLNGVLEVEMSYFVEEVPGSAA